MPAGAAQSGSRRERYRLAAFRSTSRSPAAALGECEPHPAGAAPAAWRYDEPHGEPYSYARRARNLPRIVTAEDLRAKLGRELDALRESDEALYVSKRGRLAAVLLDADRYAELVDRLEYLEDSLAALQARDESDTALPWSEVRE